MQNIVMKEIVVGREREVSDLRSWIATDRSEFIAVYGRRRVGKTFLIRNTFKDEFTFHFSGSNGLGRSEQLLNFGLSMREQSGNNDIAIPKNWIYAFSDLKKLIEASHHDKKIIFIDELPWIDTPRSGFVAALENFWNAWASWRDDVKLIVCGSATSWIINKIIRNRGGLHNRVTHSMLVKPFTLKESEEYFEAYGFGYSRMQVAECYMTLGGIPYYFSLMEKGESVDGNIDRLFFSAEGQLRNEFENLYRSLYKNYQLHIKVVSALAERGIGLTRSELLAKTKLSDNGEFSTILEELELCGFVRSYLPFGCASGSRRGLNRTSRLTLYQLVDFFSLFYLKFCFHLGDGNERFWSSMANSPRLNAWRGITFELLCQCHIGRIKAALGIWDVGCQVSSWRGEWNGRNAQADLVIDRNDMTINLCEMKFSIREFVIDKSYAEKLQEKVEIFRMATDTCKAILLTMITSRGIASNEYARMVQRQLTLDALF